MNISASDNIININKLKYYEGIKITISNNTELYNLIFNEFNTRHNDNDNLQLSKNELYKKKSYEDVNCHEKFNCQEDINNQEDFNIKNNLHSDSDFNSENEINSNSEVNSESENETKKYRKDKEIQTKSAKDNQITIENTRCYLLYNKFFLKENNIILDNIVNLDRYKELILNICKITIKIFPNKNDIFYLNFIESFIKNENNI